MAGKRLEIICLTFLHFKGKVVYVRAFLGLLFSGIYTGWLMVVAGVIKVERLNCVESSVSLFGENDVTDGISFELFLRCNSQIMEVVAG